MKQESCNQDIVSKAMFNKNSIHASAESPTSKYIESLGLIDIQLIDSTIQVDLKYATEDNFTGKILYDFHCAYLQPDIAEMLVNAQKKLKTIDSNLSLLIYDAARPIKVQRIMWDSVKNTKLRAYVANPEKISLHNYGAAVDITICDGSFTPLNMGTPFDYFGRLASVADEQNLLQEGKLTQKQIANRTLLRKVMQQSGFITISGEWWHFNACSHSQAAKRYMLIE